MGSIGFRFVRAVHDVVQVLRNVGHGLCGVRKLCGSLVSASLGITKRSVVEVLHRVHVERGRGFWPAFAKVNHTVVNAV